MPVSRLHFCHILLVRLGHRARQINVGESKYKYEYEKVWFNGLSLVNGLNMLIPLAKVEKLEKEHL